MNATLLFLSLGTFLLITHLTLLLLPQVCKKSLLNFPRSYPMGIGLLSLATLGSLLTLITTDLGEFSSMKPFFLLLTLILGVSFGYFVPAFLSIRSIGFLLLLAAHPLLQVSFLHESNATILLSLLAYGWIITGLLLVGMPYLLRDLLTWICNKKESIWWQLLCTFGLLYGLVLLLIGVREMILA